MSKLKINQLVIPGAHHAGLTQLLPYYQLIDAFIGNMGLGELFKGKSKDFAFKFINTILTT